MILCSDHLAVAFGGVKQNVEITEAETPIFKQLDIDIIEL